MSARCEMNGVDLDGDGPTHFHRCNRPASWFIVHGSGGYDACEQHCVQALREGTHEVRSFDDEPMAVDADGELQVAS